MDSHDFLKSLTIVLAVAALTTVVFQRFKQPVVLGYIIAGLIVGPHVPVPLIADREIVHTLSEMGVILLMFSLGLEFSLPKLMRVGPTAGVTAVIQSGIMAWLGFLAGRLFGWTIMESVFAGAVVAISSTTIIAKAFEEQKIGGRLRELVVGILLMEDLIAIVFMALLTAVATGAGIGAATLLPTLGKLGLFLAVLLGLGLLVIPRFVRFVKKLDRVETMLVASMGICFTIAFLAAEFGYSVALGAFLAGSLVSESGLGEEIEHLILPIRDMFLAIFFVSVGLLIDPALVAQHWVAVVVLTVVVVVGKVVSVSVGAFLTGNGVKTSIQSGMSLAQIGEFSFIIAGLGLTLRATGEFLYVVAVAVSAITTLLTPWLIRFADPFAAWVDRKLPHRLQTTAALYGSWLERIRTAGPTRRATPLRRMTRLLVLDVVLLAAVIIGAALIMPAAIARYAEARPFVIAIAAVLASPLLLGIGRLAQRLGRTLSGAALPRPRKGVDFDQAPRRVLFLTIELSVALAAGVFVVAVTQPFLPGYYGPIVLVAVLLALGIAIWRSADDLEGHVRAGSEAVAAAIASAARAGADEGPKPITGLPQVIAGLGAPVAIRLGNTSPAVGVTLSRLNLRGRTGATVLAIARGDKAIIAPRAEEKLEAGDVLAVAGTGESIEAARGVLLSGGT
jgi:CPA2 family monovalent cation:H+ antiporter-2